MVAMNDKDLCVSSNSSLRPSRDPREYPATFVFFFHNLFFFWGRLVCSSLKFAKSLGNMAFAHQTLIVFDPHSRQQRGPKKKKKSQFSGVV